MTEKLNTDGQLGLEDTRLVDDETYLLALTWLEAKRRYEDAMRSNAIAKKRKAMDDAKEAATARLELDGHQVQRFVILKEDDRRSPGQPFAIVIETKPPAEPKEIGPSTRIYKHQFKLDFRDKPDLPRQDAR